MRIDDIYKREGISVRSYNVCKQNELHTVSDLKKYYYNHQSFNNLRNCGKRSNKELIEICEKNQAENVAPIEIENPLKNLISNLTRVQREVINSFIFVNTSSLSVRSRNAIKLHLDNNLKVKNFTEKIILSQSFNVKNIRNIGRKCIPELEVYVSTIKDFIYEVSQADDVNYLIALKNKFLIQRTFDIKIVPREILESESIFQLTDFLLNQEAFFDTTQTFIVKNALKLYHNKKDLTLDQIAEHVDLTRERVRQIKKLCFEELFNRLLFISNFNDDLFQNYSIDTESSYIEINTDVLATINNLNSTHFSREFITYILAAYLHDDFTLIGNYEDVLQPNYFNARNRHNWKNFYLIDKRLASEIDFTSLSNDISSRLSDRIEESYSFNFKSYLTKFLIKNNIEVLDRLFPICERILNDEFELYLDLDENLKFQRNTQKQVPEYIVEALEHFGKPSKLSEIYLWISNNYPEATKSEDALRGSCQRSNDIIYFGRSSTFGLKKWETIRDDIKGGTMKDIIIEMLENSQTPIHITEILEEIHKYREKTNERNVITNLKLDPYNSFIIFNQRFIGLASKRNNYDLLKYQNLPVQLGKIIKGQVQQNLIKDMNQMSDFLYRNYNLTQKETENIVALLKINL